MTEFRNYTVVLPIDIADVVEAEVACGAYGSVDEACRTALEALLDKNAAIALGCVTMLSRGIRNICVTRPKAFPQTRWRSGSRRDHRAAATSDRGRTISFPPCS